jgi:[ribosomal protein S5]-alanine N-acetyltransferase
MDFPTLKTERLKLVQITKKYTESYYEILSQVEVTKYYGMDSLESIDDAERMIESMQSTFENNKGMRWAILLDDTEIFIGTLGLNNLNLWSNKAEIGYELHPSYWNKGFTTEAVKEVLRYSFEELSLFRIGAVTFLQNEASIYLLQRLGFKKEGLLRGYLYQNHQNHDAYIFSLLRTDWAQGSNQQL